MSHLYACHGEAASPVEGCAVYAPIPEVDYRGRSVSLHDGPPGQKIIYFLADEILVPQSTLLIGTA